MPPPTAVETTTASNGHAADAAKQAGGEVADTNPLRQSGKMVLPSFDDIKPKFKDAYEEREFLKGRLAAAFRIFGKLGFEEGVAGHITVRDPVNPNHFWVNPMGTSFRLMRRSDLLLINEDGKVIDGGENRKLNLAAYTIHHAVHSARPDVICAAHSHSIYGRSFSALGRPLDITTQDACAFYKDLGHYTRFGGVVVEEGEGKHIAEALGSSKAVILSNHGLLTTGGSVEAAVFWFMSLEKCCHTQLLADAAAGGRGGETVKIDDQNASFTYNTIGTEVAGWFSAKPEFDVIMKEHGDEILS